MAALLAAALPAVAPVAAAGASEPLREVLTVRPNGEVVSTRADLSAGVGYRIHVTGTYEVGGARADAECVASATLLWTRGGEAYDLVIDGVDVDWVPVTSDLTGCDVSDHRYTVELSPSSDGPLSFELRTPAGSEGVGSLEVFVEGPATEEAPPSGADAEVDPPPSDEPSTGPSEGAAGGSQSPADEREPARAALPARPNVAATSPAVLSATLARSDGEGTTEAPTREDALRRGRRLTHEELLDLFLRGGDRSSHTGSASTHDIELAARPPASTHPGARSGTSDAVPAALVLLAAAAVSARLRRPAWVALRAAVEDCWDGVAGGSRRRAVAHRRPSR